MTSTYYFVSTIPELHDEILSVSQYDMQKLCKEINSHTTSKFKTYKITITDYDIEEVE